MGAWGTAIFSDDLAADVRGEYNALLGIGKNNAEAESMIISSCSDLLNRDDEEEPVFWFALALSEWNKGRLSEFVKAKALEFLDNGGDLERWSISGNEKDYRKRVQVLDDFRKTILSAQPAEKKVKKPTVHHCPWRVGSLLAYRIVTNQEIKNGPWASMWGKYALLRVIRIDRDPVSKLAPTDMYDETMLVGLYGWSGDAIPDPSIVEQLEFIPFADYQPKRPSGVVDLSPILQLPDESKEGIMAALKDILSPERRIETCAQLDWRQYRDEKGDITLLAHDPSYEKPPSGFFRTGVGQYAWTHFLTFDVALAMQLHGIR